MCFKPSYFFPHCSRVFGANTNYRMTHFNCRSLGSAILVHKTYVHKHCTQNMYIVQHCTQCITQTCELFTNVFQTKMFVQ
ncbi:hypothetical protein X975_13858, partial [Stegodyphus mimosarum]